MEPVVHRIPTWSRTWALTAAVIGVFGALAGSSLVAATPDGSNEPPAATTGRSDPGSSDRTVSGSNESGTLDSTATGSTVVPPASLDLLGVALLSAAEVGVPDTWDIVDLDPLVDADELADPSHDPYQGLFDCADAVVPDAEEGEWIWRTFALPDDVEGAVPLTDGTLSVGVIARVETAADHAARLAELEACDVPATAAYATDAVSIQVTPVATGAEVDAPLSSADLDAPAPGLATDFVHEPTAEVAYPSRVVTVSTRLDELSIDVVIAGLDEGADWEPLAANLAGRILWSSEHRAE